MGRSPFSRLGAAITPPIPTTPYPRRILCSACGCVAQEKSIATNSFSIALRQPNKMYGEMSDSTRTAGTNKRAHSGRRDGGEGWQYLGEDKYIQSYLHIM